MTEGCLCKPQKRMSFWFGGGGGWQGKKEGRAQGRKISSQASDLRPVLRRGFGGKGSWAQGMRCPWEGCRDIQEFAPETDTWETLTHRRGQECAAGGRLRGPTFKDWSLAQSMGKHSMGMHLLTRELVFNMDPAEPERLHSPLEPQGGGMQSAPRAGPLGPLPDQWTPLTSLPAAGLTAPPPLWWLHSLWARNSVCGTLSTSCPVDKARGPYSSIQGPCHPLGPHFTLYPGLQPCENPQAVLVQSLPHWVQSSLLQSFP